MMQPLEIVNIIKIQSLKLKQFAFGATARVGQGLLIIEVSKLHTTTPPQSVGFLWTSDQLVAETSTRQHTALSQQTNVHAPGGIRTHNLRRRAALDREATCTGKVTRVQDGN